ncbi:hypothetical protein AVEN_180479-1 [Araneus ventricosus]|uniref:Uncharacterized protein n=1 Tax=Araneus ventricosus TaxID=182803 RepID=A0A4Y2NKK0_ARAVE|nr:hypothetical protein AVEN_213903-1 [Araneus ventricosus]GBN40500.1 hypothetical protein AVEN_180479-1 [Araneus ventricosus]
MQRVKPTFSFPLINSEFNSPTTGLLSEFFVREKSYMGRDQRNNLVVDIPECDGLTGNLTPGGTYEPTSYHDGAPKTWTSKDLFFSVSPNYTDI